MYPYFIWWVYSLSTGNMGQYAGLSNIGIVMLFTMIRHGRVIPMLYRGACGSALSSQSTPVLPLFVIVGFVIIGIIGHCFQRGQLCTIRVEHCMDPGLSELHSLFATSIALVHVVSPFNVGGCLRHALIMGPSWAFVNTYRGQYCPALHIDSDVFHNAGVLAGPAACSAWACDLIHTLAGGLSPNPSRGSHEGGGTHSEEGG